MWSEGVVEHGILEEMVDWEGVRTEGESQRTKRKGLDLRCHGVQQQTAPIG